MTILGMYQKDVKKKLFPSVNKNECATRVYL